MKINTLCILGGGTSGFITASVLAKYREQLGLKFDITLVQSIDIGSIGVGESTIFNINELFLYLGLKDSDWMRDCNATYKTSIRFENFYKQGRYFYYPFGPCRTDINPNQWFNLKEVYPEVFTPEVAALYFNPLSIMNEENKLCDEDDYLKNYSAYHFDSFLLGKYLKGYSEKKGVEVIEDTFLEANLNDDGYIESIICENNTYSADLFIDCSGFKSLLLGGVMEEEYISFGDTLINNKALTTKIPYTDKDKQLKNHTNCVALNNGWCWEIPLWEHMSIGYVHTNKFATEDEVKQELFDRYGEIDYTTVNYKTGRYNRGWVKNVMGIGLSYGFIEPLESTGIATTLDSIFRALEILSRRDMYYTQVDRDLYNYALGKKIDGYRNFIEMHYFFSSREDSQYWKFVTESIDYNSKEYKVLLDALIIDRNLSHINYDYNRNPFFTGRLFIAAGMNYSCYSKPFTLIEQSENDLDPLLSMFKKQIKELNEFTKPFLSSYKYLKKNIYGKKI